MYCWVGLGQSAEEIETESDLLFILLPWSLSELWEKKKKRFEKFQQRVSPCLPLFLHYRKQFVKVSAVCRLYLRLSEDPFKSNFNFRCADLDSADLLEPRVEHFDSACSLQPSFHSGLPLCFILADHFQKTLKALLKAAWVGHFPHTIRV